jgi:hypothetical protein
MQGCIARVEKGIRCAVSVQHAPAEGVSNGWSGGHPAAEWVERTHNNRSRHDAKYTFGTGGIASWSFAGLPMLKGTGGSRMPKKPRLRLLGSHGLVFPIDAAPTGHPKKETATTLSALNFSFCCGVC